MAPRAKSAAALKHMIQARMDALDDVDEDGETLSAVAVQWHAPDEHGRNWDMSGYRGAAGYATEVRLLIDRLRREYRLVESDSEWQEPAGYND